MKNTLKTIWERLKTSKVAWISLGGVVVTAARIIFGVDIEPTVNKVIESIWAVLVVFLAVNDPTTTKEL